MIKMPNKTNLLITEHNRTEVNKLNAILNYYDNPRLNDVESVRKGDRVKSTTKDFDLTEDKEYEIIEVNNTTMITIMNDIGEIDMYTVEYFKL